MLAPNPGSAKIKDKDSAIMDLGSDLFLLHNSVQSRDADFQIFSKEFNKNLVLLLRALDLMIKLPAKEASLYSLQAGSKATPYKDTLVTIIQDLIDINSLGRGEMFKNTVRDFLSKEVGTLVSVAQDANVTIKNKTEILDLLHLAA